MWLLIHVLISVYVCSADAVLKKSPYQMKQKKLHIHIYGCHRISGKKVSILQMIIANAFGWQQIFQLQFKFQWSLFLWVSWQWFSIGSVMICHQTAIKPSHVLKMTQFTLWAGSLLARFQSSWRTPNLVPCFTSSQCYQTTDTNHNEPCAHISMVQHNTAATPVS